MDYTIFRSTDIIYHYTCREIAIEILKSGRLKFGQLENTKDPYETMMKTVWVFSHSDGFQNITSDFANALEDIKKDIYVLCFSIDRRDLKPDNRFYDDDGEIQIRMGPTIPSVWAHYTDKHKGVCLMFDKIKLVQSIKALVSSGNWIGDALIKYDWKGQNQVMAGILNHPHLQEQDKYQYLKNHIKRNKDLLIFKKEKAWENEQEYRIAVIQHQKDNPPMIPIKGSFVGVVLGGNFPSEEIDNIKRYEKEYSSKTYKLTWEITRPKLKEA